MTYFCPKCGVLTEYLGYKNFGLLKVVPVWRCKKCMSDWSIKRVGNVK